MFRDRDLSGLLKLFFRYMRIIVVVNIVVVKTTADDDRAKLSKNSCIFNLFGSLSDCAANVEDVDRFNNRQFYPALQDLLQQNYFRYYKVAKLCLVVF